MADNDAKLITIHFRATKMAPRTKRAVRAIKEIKENVVRHMRVEMDQVWIDKKLNEKIWERGIQNPPKKITIKVSRFDEGIVEVTLAE